MGRNFHVSKYEHLLHEANSESEAIDRLKSIVSILRKECPWDKIQTHDSLRRCMIEEAYEAVEAIQKEDYVNLREELGDVLLQVIFHCDLAKDEGHFELKNVINDECEKMIRRHPHIFSEEEAKTVDKVLEKWENVKSKEHGNTTHTQRLKDVPKALPALLRSEKVLKKAADAGFECTDLKVSLDKAVDEFTRLIDSAKIDKAEPAVILKAVGEMIFSMVNVSGIVKVNPEEALNLATDRFIKMFEMLEHIANAQGKSVDDLSLTEADVIWREIKE